MDPVLDWGGAQSEIPRDCQSPALGFQSLQRGQDLLALRLSGTQIPLGATEELRTEWAPRGWI